jgi:hypothetical protein
VSVYKNILKGTVILSSAALMTSFVAYKSGAFKNWRGTSSSKIEVNNIPPDSLKKDTSITSLSVKEDSLKKLDSIDWDVFMMSTSKSGVIFEPLDTEKKEIPTMMGSSKSLRVWEPKDTSLVAPDKIDTNKKVTPKQSNSNGNIQKKK